MPVAPVSNASDPPGDAPPRLRLLGVPAVGLAQKDGWHALTRKDAALLARLALEGPQARGVLAAWLWPDVAAGRAQANLRQRLFRLRRDAGELVIEVEGSLSLSPRVECDVCPPAPNRGSADDALLGGLPPADDTVQAWIDDARLAWSARRAERLMQRAAQEESLGDLDRAIATVSALLAQEPLLEHAWRRLMQLHLARGDRAAALACFERCEATLRDELGVAPSPQTLALLHRAETLSTQAAVPPPGLPPALVRPMPLTGRQAERMAMANAWATQRAFVLVADAGMGKTRLLGSWAAGIAGCVLESARLGDELVPYGTLVRLLRALVRHARRPEALWPDPAVRRELSRLLPELGPAPPAEGLQALLHDAVERTLGHAPAAGVSAVLLEDLQHVDEATLSLLRRLVPTPGLFWGLSTRPGSRPDVPAWLAESTALVRIDLPPLTAAEVAVLLDALAEGRPAWRAHAAALARHSGGNPLFLLETLRHLWIDGLPPEGEPLPLPPTVQALLARRLAALSPPALDLARVAAVAGDDLTGDIAARVTGMDALSMAGPWQALEEAQVMSGLHFTHEAIRDAVLAGLPQPVRAVLHDGVGHWLQATGGAPARQAWHFAAAGRWADAAQAAWQVADAARRVGRVQERLAALDQAARWSAAAGDAQGSFRARLAAVQPVHAERGLPDALDVLQDLQAEAAACGQQLAHALERAELALAGYEQPALEAASADALVLASPGTIEHRLALGLRACACARAGHSAEAEPLLDALRSVLAAAAPTVDRLTSWNHLTVALHHLGRVPELVQALETLRVLAHEAGHVELEASALASLSGQRVALGDNDRSLADGRSAGVLMRRIGTPHLAVLNDLNLVVALIGSYELAEALELSAAAAAHLASASPGSDLPQIVTDLRTDAWLRLGEAAQARAELDAAPPADLQPVRRLHRLGLRWRVLAAVGQPDAAQSLVAPMRDALQAAAVGGVWMRAAMLMAEHHGPGEDAWRWIGRIESAARASAMPAGQALAEQVSLRLHLRAGDADRALEHARRLADLRPRARHLYVDEVELVDDVGTALAAAGRADEAQAWREQGRSWALATIEPRLPPSHRGSWRARAPVARLLGGPGAPAGA